LNNKPQTELLIVGAGIIGAWCAFLAVHRQINVVVVDRSLAGTGATRFCAGLDLPFATSPSRFRLTQESDAFYRKVGAEVPRLPIQSLPLYLLSSPHRLDRVRQCVTADGLRIASSAKRSRLPDIVPGLNVEAPKLLLDGISCRVADATGVAQMLLNFVLQTGRCRLWEGRLVSTITSEEGKTLAVFADGGTLSAAAVIWATGPWLHDNVGAAIAMRTGVRTKRVVSIHIDAPVPRAAPVVFSPEDDAFLLPLSARQQWLFSYTRERWDVFPDFAQTDLTRDDITAGQEVLARMAPTYQAKCASGRAFCDAYGPSRDPVVTRLPGEAAIIYAGAGSGSGYRLAPGIASDALRLLDNS
jgi:glycine/D-amino acid oxidase-like deaminating enzyme